MLALGRRGHLDDISIISYIVDGINDYDNSRMLRALNFKTCNDLLESLSTLSTDTKPMNVLTANNVKLEARNETKGQQDMRRGVKCFNCNNWGHISRNCSKPQRRARPGIPPTRADVAILHTPNAESQYVPAILKNLELFGRTVEGMVDTGSAHTLIENSWVPSKAERKSTITILKAYGGANIHSTEIFTTDAMFEGHKLSITFHIVPDGMSPYPILLGRDVICRKEINITFDSGELILAPKSGSEKDIVLTVSSTSKQKFDINDNLKPEQYEKVLSLLEKNDQAFAEDLRKLGRSKSCRMTIAVKTEGPIVGKRYPIAFAQRNAFSDILENLEQNGVIEKSNSPHAASVVLVPKANGELRMCVDYRALNAVTIKKNFPMPIVEEQLAKLAGNRWFTVLDMTSGYYQIPLAEESKALTAFQTHDGLYQHTVMPFGLVNAPMQFQEMMLQTISTLPCRKSVICYVDELILATPTVELGLEVLREVLKAIRAENLTLRPSKCKFLAESVIFLGHIVNSEGIQPGTEKTVCVRDFPTPTNVTEVRQFLGLTSFFRKFVKCYSLKAEPMTRLLKHSIQFDWKEEQQTAFDTLKECLVTAPVLALYDQHKLHEVHTDACMIGLSGILMQQEIENWRPVFFYSRQCTETEKKYASHELEVLAIVETLNRFRIYLLGKPFVICTDCNAIATTKATSPLPARIARWWLRLQEFDFQVVHRPGNKMSHADGLSRAPVLPAIEQSTAGEFVLAIDEPPLDWVAVLQRKDENITEIIKVLNGQPSLDSKQTKADYALNKGRLYRVVQGKQLLVVPKTVKWRVAKYAHDESGHFSVEKTVERIRRDFWFKGVRSYVKSYIAACTECCYNKVKGGKREGELHITDILPIPFRTVHIDHMGPFPRSKRGNLYVIALVCSFTKYVVLRAVRNTKTSVVLIMLTDFMSYFGQPLEIVSDRGTAFTSRDFESYVQRYGIGHRKTAVRTPRANGQVERVNKTILSAIKCSMSNEKTWDESLPNIQWCINSQRNMTTKCSPNELVFNFKLRNVTENRLVQALTDNEDETPGEATNTQVLAMNNINEERQKWKTRFDNAHSTPHLYNVDDLVVIDYVAAATGTSHKLDPAYKGPYQVTKVLGNDRYVVEDLPGSHNKRKYVGVVSSGNMKPWCSYDLALAEYDSSVEDEQSGVADC